MTTGKENPLAMGKIGIPNGSEQQGEDRKADRYRKDCDARDDLTGGPGIELLTGKIIIQSDIETQCKKTGE